MENFRAKFLEEAQEHVSDIEQALLTLEDNPEDLILIEQVFRAMHSLKGGGAMFGFDLISQFTHDLETIYDKIRNQQLSLTKNIFNLTLQSIDHLKILIANADDPDEDIKTQQQQLLEVIQELISDDKKTDVQKTVSEYDSLNDGQEQTYFIHFAPYENIFDNGSNPLYLIDEVIEMGQSYVIPRFYKLPEFDKLDPEKNYMAWDIILSTNKSVNDLNDIFIFVEDLCELTIDKIADINVLKRKSFRNKLEEIKQSGEPLSLDTLKELVKQAGSSVAQKVKKAISGNTTQTTNVISSIRVASEKLDDLMNLVSELVTTQARLGLFAEHAESAELTAISENVQKLTRQLRDIAFSIVLVPIETLITRFHRLVRDLSQELNRQVIFRSEGTDTELDKNIIESLTDPLMHIIRNSIDHGIEPADVREKNGKPARGEILFKSYYSGANVIIEISDDGAGIDPETIRAKAIENEIITKDTHLSRKEIFDLLFLPGFSTAKKVTDVSGRGVGMDVVKQQLSKIQGSIELESEKGKGTKLILKLPLTLSIIDGLLVKVSETFFVLPLSAVEKIHAVDQSVLFKQFNDLVALDGEQVPYLYLRTEFDMPKSDNRTEQLIIIRFEDKKVGLVVDSIIGEYQAVIKPLGRHYRKQDIISGATILGDGTIALVLDTNKTVNQFSIQNV
jgi:two-component system chemotaxis sensor kinase CheA